MTDELRQVMRETSLGNIVAAKHARLHAEQIERDILMTDELTQAAERVAALTTDQHWEYGRKKDAQLLARAYLTPVEVPPQEVLEAAKRLEENEYVKGQAGNIYLAMALMQSDHRTVALHFLPHLSQLARKE